MDQNSAITDALYDKTYHCLLCGETFKSQMIRSGKNRLITVDEDLYAHYDLIDPLLGDIITCPHCGYSTLSKTQTPLLSKQKEWLKEKFNEKLPSYPYSNPPTISDAIHKHKLALFACILRKSKLSEQAYISLHLSWLYRSLNDSKNELLFLKRSYDGFNEAYAHETFPMIGMDEGTLLYLLAIIAYKLDLHAESRQYISSFFSTNNAPNRIKERALSLKQKLLSK